MVSSAPQTELSQDKHATPPIVVGTDDRGRSTSAVVWAAEEAQRTGRRLLVVTAHDDPPTADDAGEHGIRALARRLALSDVGFEDVVGPAADALLRSAVDADAEMLVVGRRSLGATQRALVGSTSREVVGRAQVPVVVVPERWIQPTQASYPIVVGVDSPSLSTGDLGHRPHDDAALAFGFERATAMHVPLIVVSAWEMPSLYTWSPADVTGWRRRYEAWLDERLAPLRERHADLEVVARSLPEPAHLALLDASKVAQLTVVGRHPRAHLGGLSIGTTARHVLHGAERPVAVVPVPASEVPEEATRATEVTSRPTWAPMF
jgi:nucleotide-binding universal stress UspA family protein